MAGIYGISGSGMDVDAIVKSLMTAQRSSDAGLIQKKTALQWKKDAYNKVYEDVNTFRNTIFNYKLQATLNPKTVTSSNTAVVTATALATSSNITHSLAVSQLADGVKLTSSGTITTGTAGTLVAQFGVGTTPFDITIGNGTATKTITIDPNTETINDFVSKINSSGTNTQANYDSTLDRFFLATTNSGASTGISLTGDANAKILIDKLKLGMTNGAAAEIAGTAAYTSAAGKDALFTLDGQALTQSSNAFTISGVSYKLIGTTPAISIGITNDTDKAVASIKSLVESYNKILETINSTRNEARYIDFPPLTDDQKLTMKEADITAWDLKAKSGLLRNDTTLNSLVNVMRNAFSNPISGLTGDYTSGSSIGITTGAYTENGKLYLDETKLKTALAKDPDVLNKIFATVGTTTTVNGTTTPNVQTQGIAARLYDALKATMDILDKKSGTKATTAKETASDIAKQMKEYTTRITAATTRATKMEAAYYTKFNAMESALSKLSTQSTWLSQQLG